MSDRTVVNVSVPVRVTLHRTTFIGPKVECTRHWFGLEFEGRLIFGMGGEADNYSTREAALQAGRRAARQWAREMTERLMSAEPRVRS